MKFAPVNGFGQDFALRFAPQKQNTTIWQSLAEWWVKVGI
jgi:hypothetical protein